MKYLIVGCFCLLAACHQDRTNLAGTYTAAYAHEFGKTEDTLVVKALSKNMYQIKRHSGVIRKMDEKLFPKELLEETWTLAYDPNKQLLTEQIKGRVLVWSSQGLVFGNYTYTRLK